MKRIAQVNFDPSILDHLLFPGLDVRIIGIDKITSATEKDYFLVTVEGENLPEGPRLRATFIEHRQETHRTCILERET